MKIDVLFITNLALEPIYQSNWLVKVVGDGQVYGPKDEGKNNIYGVALLKNYTWPGAITVANVFKLKFITLVKWLG